MTIDISYHLTRATYNSKKKVLYLNITKKKKGMNYFSTEPLNIPLGEKSISRLKTALDEILVSEDDL